MENGVMKLVHNSKATDLLTELPKVPGHLCRDGKKAFSDMGNLLIKAERLKAHHLGLLESYGVFYAQWVWACREINKLNKLEPGRGFIQRFATGAKNISPEVTTRDNAFDGMLKCSKQFGLDPRSEKDIKAATETGQLDLFEQMLKSKQG